MASLRDYIRLVEEDALSEAVLALSHGRNLPIIRNPSAPHLTATLKMTRERRLRGLVIGPDLFWWNSFDAIHGEVAKEMGVEDYIDDRLDLRLHYDEVHLEFDEAVWTYERCRAHPQFARLMASPLIYFYAGSHGWVEGSEWSALNDADT